MKNVLDFLKWACSHASPDRIPSGSALCVPLADVGAGGVWQYLYGTTGVLCTKTLLARKYRDYYSKHGWSAADYAKVTNGWAGKEMVCDCQGLEDCYSGADTNAKGNYANYCTDKGSMSTIKRPYIIGEALFCGGTAATINHVGWVVGFAPDGEVLVLHERGISHGCVIERLSRSGKEWTYRGLMTKRYKYNQPDPQPESPKYVQYTGATYTNVRSTPSTDSRILGTFEATEEAIRIGKDGDWIEVVLHNQSPIIRGWCKATYVREV